MGMKSRTIRMVLEKKLGEWLKSITDEGLREKIRDNAIVSGGAITSMLLGEKPNDYDIYFANNDMAEAVAQYYVKVFNEQRKKSNKDSVNDYEPSVRRAHKKNLKGVEEERVLIWLQSAGVAGEDQGEYKYFENRPESETLQFMDSTIVATESEELKDVKDASDLAESVKDTKAPRYRPVFLTDNAITLSHRMQLILRFTGDAGKIHENFDYVHATCYYDLRSRELHLPPEALESILSKNLVYSGSLYPIASLFRIRKFISRGWRINAGQMLKIIYQVSKLDLNDRETLYDQLIGVDVAYMHQIIHALDRTKNEGIRIDETYIAELVDRIFE